MKKIIYSPKKIALTIIVIILFLISSSYGTKLYLQYLEPHASSIPNSVLRVFDYSVYFFKWYNPIFLACLILLSLATWKISTLDQSKMYQVTVKIIFGLALLSSIYYSFIVFVPVLFSALPFCQEKTFQKITSQDGRYEAKITQTDCGAATSAHRKIIITRQPFTISMRYLYLNGTPKIFLEWEGKRLNAYIDRQLNTIDRPPPEFSILGGVIIHYIYKQDVTGY